MASVSSERKKWKDCYRLRAAISPRVSHEAGEHSISRRRKRKMQHKSLCLAVGLGLLWCRRQRLGKFRIVRQLATKFYHGSKVSAVLTKTLKGFSGYEFYRNSQGIHFSLNLSWNPFQSMRTCSFLFAAKCHIYGWSASKRIFFHKFLKFVKYLRYSSNFEDFFEISARKNYFVSKPRFCYFFLSKKGPT